MKNLLCPALLACVLVSGCTSSESESGSGGTDKSAKPKLTTQIALNWYPEMEHGGYLAAKTLGLFSSAGVEVEISPGGPGAPQLVISELAAGHIDCLVDGCSGGVDSGRQQAFDSQA